MRSSISPTAQITLIGARILIIKVQVDGTFPYTYVDAPIRLTLRICRYIGISKDDLLILTYFKPFAEFRKRLV